PRMPSPARRAAVRAKVPGRLLYSSRTYDDVIYREELASLATGGVEIFHTLTRSQPAGWTGYARRIDDTMLAEVSRPFGASALTFICGPTPLVEPAAASLGRAG